MRDIVMTRVSLATDRVLHLDALTQLAEVLRVAGLHTSAQEQLWVIALDGVNNIRSITPVAVGTYHDCFVAIPTIFSPVLLSACDRFIVAHNHPNGRTKPTEDDLDLTGRIQSAASIMDLTFDDHLILEPGGTWSSMRASGHLKGGMK